MVDIDERALKAAHEIEDIFCRSFEGGRCQRLAAIQKSVTAAMTDIWDRRIAQIGKLTIEETAESNRQPEQGD